MNNSSGPGVGFHGDLRQLWSEAAKPGTGHISLYDLDPQAVQVGPLPPVWLQRKMAGTQVLWDFRAFLLAHGSEDLDEFCRFAMAKTEGTFLSFYPFVLVDFCQICIFHEIHQSRVFVDETAMRRPCCIWISQIHEEAHGDIMTAWHQGLDPKKRGKIEDRAEYQCAAQLLSA